MKTTREKIKQHLESGKKLDSDIAYKKWNTFSLQQHIHALRKQGVDIIAVNKVNQKTKTRYAEYFIDGVEMR